MEAWAWFAIFFAVGWIAYSVFGTQISIMRKCGRRLCWVLCGYGEGFDGTACKKYIQKVMITNYLILFAILLCILLFVPRGGRGGFFWGAIVGSLAASGKTGCTAQNVKEAGAAFMRFVRPGNEELISNYIAEVAQHPDALYVINKPKTKPIKTVPAWTLWACIGVFLVAAVLVAEVYIPGVRQQAEATAAEQIASERMESYNRGYDAGEEYQKNHDLRVLTIDGVDIQSIASQVEREYGIDPAEAYAILEAYSYEPNHGGITWEEYQNAIEAAVATAMYFPQMG